MQGIVDSIGSDGVFTSDFAGAAIAHLGEGYEDCKSLNDVADVGALCKVAIDNIRNTTKLSEAAKTAIHRPGENATDEDKSNFNKMLRTELGATGKVEDYTIGKPDNLPEGMPWNEDGAKVWAQKLCDMGVPASMAKDIVGAIHAGSIETFNATQLDSKTKFDASVKLITDSNQPDAITEMGRLAYKYIDTWGSEDAKEKVKGMFEMPGNFEEWNKRGVTPAQWSHMAKVAKDMQSGRSGGDGDNSGLNEDEVKAKAEKEFVNAVNSKSPGMQQK